MMDDLPPRGNLPSRSVIPEWQRYGYGAPAPKPAPKVKRLAGGGSPTPPPSTLPKVPASALRNLGNIVKTGAMEMIFPRTPLGQVVTGALAGKDIYDQYRNRPQDLPVQTPQRFYEEFYPGFRRGGKVAKGQAKVGKVMGEYKRGELHSGSKRGPVVKNPKQAIAIALSEARKAGAKIPKKAAGGQIPRQPALRDPKPAKPATRAEGGMMSKGPSTRGTPRKGRLEARMERRSRESMERAERYAPGLSIDMPDRKARGGMLVQRRKKAYSGNY